MNELLAAVAHEVAALGMRTEVVLDEFPEDGARAYVVIPHEYFACVDEELHPTSEQLGRTIAFCTEQPGTYWFDLSASHARRAGAAVDIYAGAVRELGRRGVRAEHFRLGYTGFWDSWNGDEASERPVDVVHLGAVNPRRLRALAGYAETLWPLETRLLIPPERPKTEERADFLIGASKWELLASAKTLLNVHRQESAYFEWVRVLEAASNGCVVVSEHSADSRPARPGRALRHGNAREPRVPRGRPPPRRGPARGDAARGVRARSRGASDAACGGAARGARGKPRPLATPEPAAGAPVRLPFRQAYAAVRAGPESRRRPLEPGAAPLVVEAVRCRPQEARARADGPGQEARGVRGSRPDRSSSVVASTPAYERSSPRVSVLVPLYNHAEEVTEALASVAASELRELEVVVLDDASTDGSRESVLDYFLAHPFLPALLLRHPVNRGLGRTRNDLVAAARGELVFMLDADNEVYPTAFSRLVEALDDDPEAFFAYPMLEEHEEGESDMLRSCLPWDPERLAEANYIDAMSLLRRDELVAVGGYTEDIRLHGWEDYDLWCRCLERGLRGVLVPQILARYRRAGHSMLAGVTNLDTSEAESLLRARYPVLAALRSED